MRIKFIGKIPIILDRVNDNFQYAVGTHTRFA